MRNRSRKLRDKLALNKRLGCDRQSSTGLPSSMRVAERPADAYVLACQRESGAREDVAAPGGYCWSSYRANALGASDAAITPHALYRELAQSDEERRAEPKRSSLVHPPSRRRAADWERRLSSRLGAVAARCRVGVALAGSKGTSAVARPAARHGQSPCSSAVDRTPGASSPRRAKPAESRRSQSVTARCPGRFCGDSLGSVPGFARWFGFGLVSRGWSRAVPGFARQERAALAPGRGSGRRCVAPLERRNETGRGLAEAMRSVARSTNPKADRVRRVGNAPDPGLRSAQRESRLRSDCAGQPIA
jgi:hypothetical protein